MKQKEHDAIYKPKKKEKISLEKALLDEFKKNGIKFIFTKYETKPTRYVCLADKVDGGIGYGGTKLEALLDCIVHCVRLDEEDNFIDIDYDELVLIEKILSKFSKKYNNKVLNSITWFYHSLITRLEHIILLNKAETLAHKYLNDYYYERDKNTKWEE